MDIVERLRTTYDQYGQFSYAHLTVTMREAANEIERLRTALAVYADPANWSNHQGCEHSIQDEFTDPTPRAYTNVCGCELAQDALAAREIAVP